MRKGGRESACEMLLAGVLLVLTESLGLAQHDRTQGPPAEADYEGRQIAARRQRIEQDEKNIAAQELALREFESRAIRIRRQLQGVSFLAADEMSAGLRQFAAERAQQLAGLERDIATMREDVTSQAELLEERRRQLSVDEAQHDTRLALHDRYSARSPAGGDAETTDRQDACLRQDAWQRQKQIETQNRLLMEGAQRWGWAGQAPLEIPPQPNADSDCDADELRLCEMLERRVSERDYDIAEINLLAAQGLPGAEGLVIEKALSTLDLWAAWVEHETDRHLYKFREAPGEYHGSEGYFRMLVMVCTLQEDFKICYNKDPKMRAGPVEVLPDDFTFFANSRDLFIHGLTEGEHQGTCASLPVLYVAVGRRLGYPLKLVECKGHLFVRWQDAKERFNIEGTNRGLNCYPDDEYMEWPWPISKEELETGMYMKSLSPRRELAAFLESRALCLMQHKREKQRWTVKGFADRLRKKEGVDLDKLNDLMRQYVKSGSGGGTAGSVFLYHTLSNTNRWRSRANDRGAPGKHTVFATERPDDK